MHEDHTESPTLTMNNDEDFCCLFIKLVLLLPLGVILIGFLPYFASLYLDPDVISSFVSSNGSHLIASWDVTLDLGIWTPQGHPLYIDRVEASLSHPTSHHQVVPSTRLFRMKRTDRFNHNIRGIHLRAEDDGAHCGFDSSLQFGLSVQVWARLGRNPFSDRYYFAQVNCNPDWIGSSDLLRWLSRDEKKCQFHLIQQSKSDYSWKTMSIIKMKTVECTKSS
ncbi:hypothetical protein LINGRAHAP2_LOCUS13010 [Linum grandiflorum]